MLLEMFTSVDFEKAVKIMDSVTDEDILVKHFQEPVLLSEVEPLTLDELRPRKGEMGGRYRKNQERPADDYLEDEDPEWMNFEPETKKFDFSKQQTLTKMFGDDKDAKLESLEDDEELEPATDTKNESKTQLMPISIEELEKQQMTQLEQNSVKQAVAAQKVQKVPGQFDPAIFNPNQANQQFGQPQPWGGNQQPGFVQNQPPPFVQNQPNFVQNQLPPFGGQQVPPQNMQKQAPFGQQNDTMGFGGFGGSDPFGSTFGMPSDDQTGFGSNIFSSPFNMQPDFDPNNPFGAPTNDKPQSLDDIFGFGAGNNQFTGPEQDDDDDEEDDWLMPDQIQDNLQFIDGNNDPMSQKQHPMGAMPIRVEDIEATQKTVDDEESAFKFVRKTRIRPPKPSKQHTFEPKLKSKKRFEKLFEKVVGEEDSAPKVGTVTGKIIWTSISDLV